MEFAYKIVGIDTVETGCIIVEYKCPARPSGGRMMVRVLKDDGTYYEKDEILQRIEAALPVAEMETLLAVQTNNPDDTHIRELLLEPVRTCDRSPMDQGALKPIVL